MRERHPRKARRPLAYAAVVALTTLIAAASAWVILT